MLFSHQFIAAVVVASIGSVSAAPVAVPEAAAKAEAAPADYGDYGN